MYSNSCFVLNECNYCGKLGHLERVCYKKKRERNSRNEQTNESIFVDDHKELHEVFVNMHCYSLREYVRQVVICRDINLIKVPILQRFTDGEPKNSDVFCSLVLHGI